MARIMKTMLFAIFLALIISGCSSMKIKEQTEVVIEPSRSHEDCMELASGDTLYYLFETSGSVGFNVHYHKEKEIVNLVSKDNTSFEKGRVFIEEKQFYCLMWTNPLLASVKLTYTFRVEEKK